MESLRRLEVPTHLLAIANDIYANQIQSFESAVKKFHYIELFQQQPGINDAHSHHTYSFL
jgi:hypothetical protein